MPPMKIYPGFTKEQLREQGIYAFIRKDTGRIYIGSTHWFFGGRFAQHISLLERNDHHCRALQFDWSRYGIDAFELCILYTSATNCGYSPRANKWRDYLERKCILEAINPYNARIFPLLGYPPDGENPFRLF